MGGLKLIKALYFMLPSMNTAIYLGSTPLFQAMMVRQNIHKIFYQLECLLLSKAK